MFNDSSWDGMNIIVKSYYNLGLNSSDAKIRIPHRMHQRLLEDYLFVSMYTDSVASLCPGGYF